MFRASYSFWWPSSLPYAQSCPVQANLMVILTPVDIPMVITHTIITAIAAQVTGMERNTTTHINSHISELCLFTPKSEWTDMKLSPGSRSLRCYNKKNSSRKNDKHNSSFSREKQQLKEQRNVAKTDNIIWIQYVGLHRAEQEGNVKTKWH